MKRMPGETIKSSVINSDIYYCPIPCFMQAYEIESCPFILKSKAPSAMNNKHQNDIYCMNTSFPSEKHTYMHPLIKGIRTSVDVEIWEGERTSQQGKDVGQIMDLGYPVDRSICIEGI